MIIFKEFDNEELKRNFGNSVKIDTILRYRREGLRPKDLEWTKLDKRIAKKRKFVEEQEMKNFVEDETGTTVSGRTAVVKSTKKTRYKLFSKYKKQFGGVLGYKKFAEGCNKLNVHFKRDRVSSLSCTVCRNAREEIARCKNAKEKAKLKKKLEYHQKQRDVMFSYLRMLKERTRNDKNLIIVQLDASTFEMEDRGHLKVVSCVLVGGGAKGRVLFRYLDFLGFITEKHPYRAPYFILACLLRNNFIKQGQEIYIASDGGSNDYKNNYFLFSISHFMHETGIDIKEVFFLGPRHGYLDNDRHFGRMKQDFEAHLQENEEGEKGTIELTKEGLLEFLNKQKNVCAFDVSRCRLPKVSITKPIVNLKKYLSFMPSATIGSFTAKDFPNNKNENPPTEVIVEGRMTLEGGGRLGGNVGGKTDGDYQPLKRKKRK